MTAEAVSIPMAPESSLPDWIFPPPEGFTAEDLDHLPHLPAHTELIDGSLVFVSPQLDFHTSTIYLLEAGLRRAAPKGYRVRREMSVKLGPRQRPEPDLIVLKPGADVRSSATYYPAGDVALAVEVVSPESEERDRKRKPLLYAEAGIPHFWRVENDSGRPVVYVYELDPATRAYVPTGIHHDRAKVTVPFDMDIDLAEIDSI
ncbi:MULTISPECIES: Uma2 family endonuclease [Nonomuraea]|uniref:Uma2 family endonuclease n=1 Tax=Nonomuraea ferruginea TaxID=46174 RepID=A0ABT4TA50_9ACTN|nr:Uma2 family endonuclease [Nonomuraea ferruginea]MDA0646008.1 Uma2 family endonuclease [Nonomuraea ferruginea]